MFGMIKLLTALVLLLFVYESAASPVRGNEALLYYYAYLADYAVFGQQTLLAPELSRSWTGTGPPELGDFLKTIMNRNFVRAYNADPEAQRICSTTTPDKVQVATFLNNYHPMISGQNNLRLFPRDWQPPTARHPDRVERVVSVLQRARLWGSIDGRPEVRSSVVSLNEQAVYSLDQAVEGRILDNGPSAIEALRNSGIEGLNLVTRTSEFDGRTQVPDMYRTIRTSELSDADYNRLLTYLVDLGDGMVDNHAIIISALNAQLSRIMDDDPEC